jgi:hypothetical protein
MEVLPENEVSQARKIREEGSPGNPELREVLKQVVNICYLHCDSFQSQFLDSLAIVQGLQANLFVQEVLNLSEDHETPLLGRDARVHGRRFDGHRMNWQQCLRIAHFVSQQL